MSTLKCFGVGVLAGVLVFALGALALLAAREETPPTPVAPEPVSAPAEAASALPEPAPAEAPSVLPEVH